MAYTTKEILGRLQAIHPPGITGEAFTRHIGAHTGEYNRKYAGVLVEFAGLKDDVIIVSRVKGVDVIRDQNQFGFIFFKKNNRVACIFEHNVSQHDDLGFQEMCVEQGAKPLSVNFDKTNISDEAREDRRAIEMLQRLAALPPVNSLPEDFIINTGFQIPATEPPPV